MTNQKQNSNIVAIVMMIFLFAMIAFVTNLAAPMGVIVKAQFLEGSANANFLGMLGNFANFLAYLCMGIPAGILLKKIGYKKTALLAVAVGFAGVGVQFLSGVASSFIVYLTGAFISGFSMCMLNIVVNPMLNNLGGGGNKGNQLIQVGGTFNSLTGTVTPIFVGALIGTVTKDTAISDVNPILFIAMGVFATAFIILSLVSIPEPHREEKSDVKVKDKYSPWSFRHCVFGVIGIFIYVGIEIGVPGTLNLYLADMKNGAKLDPATAGSVAATYWFLMLTGRFLGSMIGGKISSKLMLTVASGVGMVLTALAIFSSPEIMVSMPIFTGTSFALAKVPVAASFLVLIGLCTSVMWGVIFNLAVEGLGKYVAAASGIFMMMVVGGGILPLLQNYIADQAGYMVSYWVIFAGLAYLLYYALIGCKNVNKDIPVE
jgi:Fucose permease